LILLDIREDDPLRSSINDIRAAAQRAADLTRQLLAFSRRQLLQPRVLDLNALIRESTKMLKRVLGEDIELVTVLEPHLARVNADPGQIDQVIVNLAVNARDAMPQGGRLTIETQNVVIGEHDAQKHASLQPGDYVMMAISNSGHAIDPGILPHIFEPFFTTKERGEGTGLGLSMVYGIVKQSGGWIWVYSEPGHGTSFKIYLPRVDKPVPSAEEKHVDIESQRGNETVLVVEDEESVRKLTCQALRTYGYHVIEAASGGEALLACERRAQPIPLLITDVVMPQTSGPELAARLRQLRPEMRVLYTSGYTDDAVVRHGLLDQTVSFLQKPFSPGALARMVREILDQ
jgi:two-component system cell cycle sensor histidine kinase/response regulator CckA